LQYRSKSVYCKMPECFAITASVLGVSLTCTSFLCHGFPCKRIQPALSVATPA
jgi:hypothetical protein